MSNRKRNFIQELSSWLLIPKKEIKSITHHTEENTVTRFVYDLEKELSKMSNEELQKKITQQKICRDLEIHLKKLLEEGVFGKSIESYTIAEIEQHLTTKEQIFAEVLKTLKRIQIVKFAESTILPRQVMKDDIAVLKRFSMFDFSKQEETL